MIRYADDFVIGVAREDDARRIMDVLPKRMSKYDLTVHPEKTRLVRFEPPQAVDSETEERDPPEPRTFDFLGFTHYWGRSQRGAWVVKRKTAKSRLNRRYQRIGLVRKKSAPSGQGATPKAHAKTAGPLWVLRDHWQLLLPPGIPGGCTRDLATVAVSAPPRQTNAVVQILSSGGAVQSSPPRVVHGLVSSERSHEMRSRMPRRRASPDLWEPGRVTALGDPAVLFPSPFHSVTLRARAVRRGLAGSVMVQRGGAAGSVVSCRESAPLPRRLGAALSSLIDHPTVLALLNFTEPRLSSSLPTGEELPATLVVDWTVRCPSLPL